MGEVWQDFDLFASAKSTHYQVWPSLHALPMTSSQLYALPMIVSPTVHKIQQLGYSVLCAPEMPGKTLVPIIASHIDFFASGTVRQWKFPIYIELVCGSN